MSLEKLPAKGFTFDQEHKILKELQGLKVDTLVGAASSTPIALAAIRPEDTIVAVLEVVATSAAVNDRLGATTITDLRATGTLTVGSQPAAAAQITVAGKVYTFRAAADPMKNEITIGASTNATAANIAAKLATADVSIVTSVSTNVVTVKAAAEGVAGNAFTLVGVAGVTASAGTLAGGAATGSIAVSAVTTGNKLIVIWFNKN